MSGEDARVWWPVSADHVTARAEGDILHAVDQWSTRRRDRRYRLPTLKSVPPNRWSVVCGARVKAVVGATAVNADLEPSGGMVVLAWPPPAKSNEGDRCRDCWQTTGRKRPNEQWHDLVPMDQSAPVSRTSEYAP